MFRRFSGAWYVLWGVTVGMVVVLAACDSVVTDVEGVRIQDFPEGTLAVGETVQARAESIGRGWPDQVQFEWFSEDPGVARVTGSGQIQAVSPGETRIAAAYAGHHDERRLVVVAPLSIESGEAPDGEVGESYRHTLGSAGGEPPYRWSVVQGSLPPGLSLPETGVIGGTPTEAGSWAFTIRVMDGGQRSVEALISIQVEEAPRIVTAELPSAEVGEQYQAELEAEGGRTPYNWSLETGRLPDGLSLSAQGVISGTPSSVGEERFTLRVTGANGLTSTRTFQLEVVDPPVASVTVGPDRGSVVVGLTLQMTATVRGARGQELPGRTVSWESTNPSIARVDASGLVTGVSTGTATITATSEGVMGSSLVTVVSPQTRPIIAENLFRWIEGRDQCGEGARDGRTAHGFRFTLPTGVSGPDDSELEAQYRYGLEDGVTQWLSYRFELLWEFVQDGDTWEARRRNFTCWQFFPGDLWIDERVRIRVGDGEWSDWSSQRLFLRDRPATLDDLESGRLEIPEDAVRLAPVGVGPIPRP